MVQSSAHLDSIRAVIQAIDQGKLTTEENESLLQASKELINRLEPPEEKIWRVAWGVQAQSSLRAAIRIKIFDVFPGTQDTITAAEIADKTGAEKLLVVRIMRALVVSGIFADVNQEQYRHTPASRKLTNQKFRAMVYGLADTLPRHVVQLPEFLRDTSLQSPNDVSRSVFNYAQGTDMSFFEWLTTEPEKFAIFSECMAATSASSHTDTVQNVSGLFPSTQLGEHSFQSQSSDVLLVDIGSGRGKILDEVRQMRPDLKGRFIMQDLAQEINKIASPGNGVETMVHDFFQEQPIKEAFVYYFRHVIHDWPDKEARKIIQNTVRAMEKGKSRLVIADAILPDTNAPYFGTMLDINMMALSGIERTESDWRQLLEGEGLTIVEMRRPPRGWDGIIQATIN